MGRLATDKRERLVAAALEQFHRRGYARTSIAQIAATAGMPAGNVFYFFKAKEDLARAVVDEWCRLLTGYLAALDPLPGYRQRVQGFIEQARDLSGMYVTLGCPLAGIARDLRQERPALQVEAGRPHALQFTWLAGQFAAGGYSPSKATAHARFLMAGYHGAILLAHAQGDPGLIDDEVASLTAWLQALPEPAKAARTQSRRRPPALPTVRIARKTK
jgi:AcrR family transcriptional regulator